MDTELIARRLSFGASKIGFPMDKYLSYLDEWDQELAQVNCIKLSKTYDPNMEQEERELKEYETKLKFNYLELFTKNRFLVHLQEETAANESKDAERRHKNDFKVAKTTHQNLEQQISAAVSALVETYDKFKNQRLDLLNQLESAKKEILAQFPEEDTHTLNRIANATSKSSENVVAPAPSATEAPAKKMKVDLETQTTPLKDQTYKTSKGKELSTHSEWLSEMIVLVGGMSGVSDVQFDDENNSVALTVTSSLAHFQVEIRFKDRSTTVEQLKISPADVIPFWDIVDSAADETDFQSLINAILDRVNTFQKRQLEIDDLSEKYTVNYSALQNTLAITLRSGVVVTITMQMYYPNEYSRATIINIEAADSAMLDKLQPLKVELNSSRKSLSELVERLDVFASSLLVE